VAFFSDQIRKLRVKAEAQAALDRDVRVRCSVIVSWYHTQANSLLHRTGLHQTCVW
jgi:hypothetical protein